MTVSGSPGRAWLRTWCEIDGPGTPEGAEVAGRIMAGAPSWYLTAHLRDGATGTAGPVVGVARATPVGTAVALACIAVTTTVRRRGVGRALVAAAVRTSDGAGVAWLQVLRSNRAAGSLYERLGFRQVGGYSYLEAPTGRPVVVPASGVGEDLDEQAARTP